MHARLLGVTAAIALLSGVAAAKTPRDQLIIGMNLNNMLSSDPHAVGQFEPAHVLANVYDMLVTTDAADPAKIVPALAEFQIQV